LKLLIGILLLPCVSFAGYKYHSENLALMDIESIQRLVGKSLAEADKSVNPGGPNLNSPSDDIVSGGQGAEALKDALKLVFARPEQNECLKSQNTSLFVLINMIEEVKPQVQNGNEDEDVRKILVKIRDAGISYSNALKNHRLLSSNLKIQNPSKAASLVVGKKKKAWWKFWTWFS